MLKWSKLGRLGKTLGIFLPFFTLYGDQNDWFAEIAIVGC